MLDSFFILTGNPFVDSGIYAIEAFYEKNYNELSHDLLNEKIEKIEISLRKETIWLTLNQNSKLFNIKKPPISKHIKNIYSSIELIKKAAVSILETKRKLKRNITFYSLDVVISVGYRINHGKATQFRIRATQVLKRYLTKGYAINKRTGLTVENSRYIVISHEKDEVYQLKKGVL